MNSFIKECIKESLSVWNECLSTDFLQKLSSGKLDEECFKGYIVDDSLYLREYAKVFAYGILKSSYMENIRIYYSLLSFVNESEDSTRLYYINRYGLDDRKIQELPLRPQNKSYVEYMLKAAENSTTLAECMAATLPCMLSYAWIFQKILNDCPDVKKSIYSRFICDYSGNNYSTLCNKWIAFADSAALDLSDEIKQRCKKIFYDCSLFELEFWKMSSLPRNDI